MNQALLIFVKNAVKGAVKTRLAATVGDEVAFHIYQQLLTHTEKCAHSLLAHKIVFYADHVEFEDIWSNRIYQKQVQTGIDLGERMQNAFEYAFNNGHDRVVIIGSDCFEINAEMIENAFAQLEYGDVVLGPALDGGYYLLALKSNCKALFQHIDWSTDRVLKQTMQMCDQLDLKIVMLEELSDIDHEDDLKRMGYQY